ncbi:hypothetical protein BU15DRAFT_66611 [Melanogaster broomeanus]|nr:hypothetical protein BU15DRAFT_66611 [Melanogaster broomeanus]
MSPLSPCGSFTYSHSASATNDSVLDPPRPTTTAMDIDVFMDTSQDFDAEAEVAVRWVASQSPNPVLQALMKEAEKEKRSRPATPVFVEPFSWTHTLTTTPSSASTSSSTASLWNSTNNTTRTSSLPLIPTGSTAIPCSSSAYHARGSDPSTLSRHAKPSFAQRKPLSASTSSANQHVRPSISARQRSSSQSTSVSSSKASTSRGKHNSPEDEPEAVAFLALLKDVSRQVDANSRKKQRMTTQTKEKVWGRSLGRSVDDRMGLDTDSTNNPAPRVLAKTSSASAICPSGSSGRMLERTSSASGSTSASNHGSGRVLTKTASLSSTRVGLGSGRCTPTPVCKSNLDHHDSVSRLLTNASRGPTIGTTNMRVAHNTLELSSNDGARSDSPMDGVVLDLNETDAEWEKHISVSPATRAVTTTYLPVDEEDSDMGMDISFCYPISPQPQPHVPVPTPKPNPSQINITSRQLAPAQRARTGPPPLGMRRLPHLQPSQYTLSQTSKSAAVPRFKPPLRANGGGTGSDTKPVTPTSTSKATSPWRVHKEGRRRNGEAKIPRP